MGPLLRRFRLYWSMLRYGQSHNLDFAREHFEFFSELKQDVENHLGGIRRLRVLDIGCGKTCWLTLLLQISGAQVTGIDTEVVDLRRTPSKYWKVFRRNGLERVARTAVWDWMFARPYYRALGKHAALRLKYAEVDARCMSVTNLDFEDDTFAYIKRAMQQNPTPIKRRKSYIIVHLKREKLADIACVFVKEI